MRILQLVTLISPDGAYGGPVRVALNQASALRELGHSVTLGASCRGYEVVPDSLEGTPAVLRPARKVAPGVGFAGLTSPGLFRWALGARREFDVVHVHLARDLVLLPVTMALAAAGKPYVLQPHGMIVKGSHILAPALDRLAVRRLLARAHEVFYLTDAERDALDDVAQGKARLTPLSNGVPLYEPPIVADTVPEVLYLSRLQARKRPVDFVAAALGLSARGLPARYTLVGPDEGEGGRVREAIGSSATVSWEGALPSGAGPARMRRASIFVLPSVDEPYPMAVLEAMSVGLPVVITDTCGLAHLVRRYECGLVVPAGAASIEEAIAELLTKPGLAKEMGQRGRLAVERDLGMTPVAERLQRSYFQATDSVPATGTRCA